MSGLLRSLAAQALNQAPSLRPAVRLRRDAEPDAAGEFRPALQEWPQGKPARENSAANIADSRFFAVRSDRDADSGFWQEARPASVGRISPGETAVPAHSQDSEGQGDGSPLRIPLSDAGGGSTSPRPPASTSASREEESGLEDKHSLPSPLVSIARRVIAAAEERNAIAPRAEGRTRAEPAVVSARVGPARESQPSVSTRVPDVHVHIGRIELTAVNPPQAGRRERPVAGKPSALDDYLQRRGGKKP